MGEPQENPTKKKMSEGPKSHLCFPGIQLAQNNLQLSFHCCRKSMDNPVELKTSSAHSERKNPTQNWNSDEKSLDY